MRYELTEEMVMREFYKDEVHYRCARIETWLDGDNYARQVGYIRVPEELFSDVKNLIESSSGG